MGGILDTEFRIVKGFEVREIWLRPNGKEMVLGHQFFETEEEAKAYRDEIERVEKNKPF